MIPSLRLALGFLTTLPVPFPEGTTPEDWGRSLLHYPLVGLLLGGILAGVAPLLALIFPPGLQAALLLALWVHLTGGLHLDGLADCADGWAAAGDRERTLDVLKDPRSGPAAITVLVLTLLLKWSALLVVIGQHPWWHWIWVPMAGRGVMTALLLTTPYVNPTGLGAQFAAHLPRRAAMVVLGGWSVLAVLLAGPAAMKILAAALVVLLLGRSSLLHRLGGTTGDGIGAMGELTELAALLALAPTLA